MLPWPTKVPVQFLQKAVVLVFLVFENFSTIISELLRRNLTVSEPQQGKGLIPRHEMASLLQQRATAFPVTEPDVRINLFGAVARCAAAYLR